MNKGIKMLLAAGVTAISAVALSAAPAHAGSLQWRGEVDDTATLYIRGNDVRVESNLRGVRNERKNFRDNLPRRNVRIFLREQDGRGRIQLVQEPSARNNYTAVVRIQDRDPGSDRYSFTLTWDDDDRWNGRDRGDRDGRDWRDRDRDRRNGRDWDRDRPNRPGRLDRRDDK